MQKAMLAAEDQDFYSNNGISPTGIARAVWVAVKGGQATQGGSTITQQYVKNYFLTQDRTLSRKAREILISLKIDKQQSKDQILENYLNTIYYGRGAYGIQTASKAYFRKDVSKLTVAESAFLASVIRGPSFYDPALGDDQEANAKERSGFILDAMEGEGWISAGRAPGGHLPRDQALPEAAPRAAPPATSPRWSRTRSWAPTRSTRTPSTRVACGSSRRSTGSKQNAMVAAVKEERPEAKDVHVGMASVKPGDGGIVSLYGGEDYSKRQQNAATQDKMQAGSTFKIFTLIAALQSGDVSLKTRFDGSSPQFFEEFADPNASTSNGRRGRVKNFGDESFGRIDLLRATGRSVNTVYAELNIEAGPEKSMKAAEDAGVRSKLEPNMSNVLGTDYVTVLDMANAYATIAAQGKRAQPYIIKEIRFVDQTVPTIKVKRKTQQVFDKDLMADVITAMQEPVDGGTARYVGENLGRPAAGKTGTSESFRSAWFNGFVPQLQAAVGLFRSGKKGEELKMEDLPGEGNITGGTFPARIWTAYMKVALERTDVEDFPKPANINPDADPPPPPPPPPTTFEPEPSAPPTTSEAPPTTTEPEPEPTPSKTKSERQPHPRAADPVHDDLTDPSLTRSARTVSEDAPRVQPAPRTTPSTPLGGPAGRRLRPRAAGPLAALAPVVLLLALPLAAAVLRQASCLSTGWAGRTPLWRQCASPLVADVTGADLGRGLLAYLSGSVRVDEPVVTGSVHALLAGLAPGEAAGPAAVVPRPLGGGGRRRAGRPRRRRRDHPAPPGGRPHRARPLARPRAHRAPRPDARARRPRHRRRVGVEPRPHADGRRPRRAGRARRAARGRRPPRPRRRPRSRRARGRPPPPPRGAGDRRGRGGRRGAPRPPHPHRARRRVVRGRDGARRPAPPRHPGALPRGRGAGRPRRGPRPRARRRPHRADRPPAAGDRRRRRRRRARRRPHHGPGAAACRLAVGAALRGARRAPVARPPPVGRRGGRARHRPLRAPRGGDRHREGHPAGLVRHRARGPGRGPGLGRSAGVDGDELGARPPGRYPCQVALGHPVENHGGAVGSAAYPPVTERP